MKFVAGVASLALSFSCFAQIVEQPAIKAGDTWKYRTTLEKGGNGWSQTLDEITVTRATAFSIYYSIKQTGSTQPAKELIAGADWSRKRDVNGKETLVNQPMSFPLSAGKSWDIQYIEQHPNPTHRFEQWSSKFSVVGFETVDVPAGKFNALKIESEGNWTAELEPMQTVLQGAQTSESAVKSVTEIKKTVSAPVSGRTYKAFWYAPEAKRWVKSVEEYYSGSGVRNERYTSELESFSLAK